MWHAAVPKLLDISSSLQPFFPFLAPLCLCSVHLFSSLVLRCSIHCLWRSARGEQNLGQWAQWGYPGPERASHFAAVGEEEELHHYLIMGWTRKVSSVRLLMRLGPLGREGVVKGGGAVAHSFSCFAETMSKWSQKLLVSIRQCI